MTTDSNLEYSIGFLWKTCVLFHFFVIFGEIPFTTQPLLTFTSSLTQIPYPPLPIHYIYIYKSRLRISPRLCGCQQGMSGVNTGFTPGNQKMVATSTRGTTTKFTGLVSFVCLKISALYAGPKIACEVFWS